MEANTIPAVRPFAVWFVPEDTAPRRVGQQMAAYDDALALAEIAALDLPRYGYASGQVLVMWNTSVLKMLQPGQAPAAPGATPMAPALEVNTELHRAVARLVLEDLHHLSSLAEPTLAAPPEWIERLESALQVIASPADQRRFRLDGLHCITTDYVHRHVAAVLRQFDHLVAAGVPLPPPPDVEARLAL